MAKTATKTTNKPAASKAVGFLAGTALSADVGQKAVLAFVNIKENNAAIKELTEENQGKRYETLKSLTMAFVKAARADNSINLRDVHSEKEDISRALKVKLEVATGIRIATANSEGGFKTEYAPWTADHFPQTGENKKLPEIKKKETFRTNFSAVFKKAMLAAHGIVAKGVTMSETKDGILKLEGKAIKEHFNQDAVLLNEKQTITVGEGDKAKQVQLAAKPSYTEIGRMSAAEVGTTVGTRVDSRAKLGGAKLTEADILAAVESMTKTVAGLKDIGDKLADALEALQEACETAIGSRSE